MQGPPSVSNAIRGNAVFSNGGLGISLSGTNVPTQNDLGDADTGPNERQNYPVLTEVSVAPSALNTIVKGYLNSVPEGSYDLDFFANTQCDPSGFGEGEFFLGTYRVTTDDYGKATFSATLNRVAPFEVKAFTATATDQFNNTSEFSGCLISGGAPNPDHTPPVTSGLASPPRNANGWNNSNVTVTLTAADEAGGSGVKEISVALTGAQTANNVVPGSSAIVSVTNEGSTTLTYFARDQAGNAETGKTLTILIDKTAPLVLYSGNAGAYDVDKTVNISCAATDGLSGIQSQTCQNISGPAYLFNLGVNRYSASATDRADNTGSGSTSFTVQVSSQGLSNLTTLFVTNAGIAQGLVSMLAAAADAAARGNLAAKAGIVTAYTNAVTAQIGKTLTAQQAAILIALASAL